MKCTHWNAYIGILTLLRTPMIKRVELLTKVEIIQTGSHTQTLTSISRCEASFAITPFKAASL